MRLLRNSRAAGPTVAHSSRYGPQNIATITPAQRDAVYQQILDRLSLAGNLSWLVEQNDLGAARRLAREVTDDLRLVLEALGWGETSGDEAVELRLPAEQLRRTFARLRETAIEQCEASSQGAAQASTLHQRALIVIETCDQVLAVADTSSTGAEIAMTPKRRSSSPSLSCCVSEQA
jgi:hypothetical protein